MPKVMDYNYIQLAVSFAKVPTNVLIFSPISEAQGKDDYESTH